MSTLSYTLEGDRLTLWEGDRVLLLGIADSPTLSAGAAGLLSNLFRYRGDTELADLLWTAHLDWLSTPEGRASLIMEQPVWRLDAGAGLCAGCERECERDERHYYALPHTGTVPLCLDCGPDESNGEHRAHRLAHGVSWP